MSCTKKGKLEKIVSKGVALEDGFYIYYTTLCKNINIQALLDSFSDLSLAKAYYYTFESRHYSCRCLC